MERGQFYDRYVQKDAHPERLGGVYRGAFALGETGDTFLRLENMTKGMVWVNGVNVGRYWDIGPQRCLYVPGVYLRRGENELLVVEAVAAQPGTARGFASLAECEAE